MSAIAGRVLIIPQGTYDANAEYHLLDAVFFNGSTYIAKDTTTGNPPSDTQHWQVLAQGAQDAAAAVFFGTCITAGSSQNKEVSVEVADNFALKRGAIVGVKFSNTNTFVASAANHITLNVNSSGVYSIYFGNSADPEGANPVAFGEAGFTNYYQFDGTYWTYVGRSGVQTAEETPYDNTSSGLASDNVNDAIDETYTEAKIVKASNRNLLDNPWFTVNQRGLSTYSGGSQYTADRWKYDYAGSTSSIGVSSSGITINNTSSYTFIEQKFESLSNLLNRPLTASILFSDGTIKSGTAIFDGTASINFLPTTEDVRLQMSYPANSFRVVSYSSSPVTIRAVKLELGSHSTLHLDTAPDYTTELLKCQRYFVRISADAYKVICIGYVQTTTKLSSVIPLSVPLRATPTATTSGTFKIFLNDTEIPATVSVGNMQRNNLVGISATTTSTLTKGQCGSIITTTNGSYIDLSADL